VNRTPPGPWLTRRSPSSAGRAGLSRTREALTTHPMATSSPTGFQPRWQPTGPRDVATRYERESQSYRAGVQIGFPGEPEGFAVTVSFKTDTLPLFTSTDIEHMSALGWAGRNQFSWPG
jgi:hypothetical protein